MRIDATELTAAELHLQQEVRAFLSEQLPTDTYPLGLGMSGASDPAFSRALGTRGWLGMALPREYGGGGRSAVERLVVVEELLAVGAPVGYHWIGDRQSGPNIATNGTDAQKRELLPGIASGELSFSIGMSEPGSGSDLASLRTRARPVDGGWIVSGTKIWTTGAYEATHILALFRTSDDRHSGLTQFIVERNLPGLTVTPIPFIDGSRDFCELTFDEVFIPDEMRLGEVGAGWGQNIAELALERGGVDRWMSMMPVINHWASGAWGPLSDGARADLGLITARMWGLRGVSLSIARMVDEGKSPSIEAALAKEMATRFEQDCVEIAGRHFGRTPDLTSTDPYEALLARATLVSPSWSIRGGTIEILRNIVSKGLAIA
ncbi:acyl-CoA dehydrogenase family protein [Microbacterium profundi]|uniref:Acyl-CoA dehydrogenase family protein n=1 Tax=Microbacterium profundi TaxID=450380 RepID=A0ABV3LD60_9MICO